MDIESIKRQLVTIQQMCSDVLGKIEQSKIFDSNVQQQSEPVHIETPATLPILPMTVECARFKTMLDSEAWPKAVLKELICDDNNEQDKFDRATGIINVFISELVEGKKLLDFGCGLGHVPFAAHLNKTKMSVGYDVVDNFAVNSQDNLILTTDWQKVIDNGPYDIITVFDVMDHLIDETPVNVLLNLKTVLSPNGKIYARYHPYLSRHGGHLYKKINKAFVHLVFTPDEIKSMIPDYVPETCTPVVQPIRAYSTIPVLSGFRILKEYITKSPVENFFKQSEIKKRILENTGLPVFSEQDLCIEFVDHCYIAAEQT